MRIQNFALIFLCFLNVFQSTHQTSQLFGLKRNFKIAFDNLLFNALKFLQEKLANGLFTNEDVYVLNGLKNLILQKKEILERERKKDHTVYWLSRQGRLTL